MPMDRTPSSKKPGQQQQHHVQQQKPHGQQQKQLGQRHEQEHGLQQANKQHAQEQKQHGQKQSQVQQKQHGQQHGQQPGLEQVHEQQMHLQQQQHAQKQSQVQQKQHGQQHGQQPGLEQVHEQQMHLQQQQHEQQHAQKQSQVQQEQHDTHEQNGQQQSHLQQQSHVQQQDGQQQSHVQQQLHVQQQQHGPKQVHEQHGQQMHLQQQQHEQQHAQKQSQVQQEQHGMQQQQYGQQKPTHEQQQHQQLHHSTKSRRHPDSQKCRICEEEYNEEMVMCDGKCKKWFHYSCVDLDGSQAGRLYSWFCEECTVVHLRKLDALHEKLTTQLKVVEKNVKENKRQTVIDASYNKWFKLKSEYVKLKGSHTDIEGNQLPVPRLRESEYQDRVVEGDRLSIYSKSSSSSRQSMRLRLIQQQRDILKEQRDNLKRDEELLRQQEEIINELSSESEEEVNEFRDGTRFDRWNEKPTDVNEVSGGTRFDRWNQKPMDVNEVSGGTRFDRWNQKPMDVNEVFNGTRFNRLNQKPMDPLAPEFTPVATLQMPQACFETPPPLTQREISARKIYRDLPNFTGQPEEWPLFKRMFEKSTQACGYTIDENLMRLQQALKGKARNLVASQLVEPSCVPQIMECLSFAFGQPNIILESQLEKINKIPMVKGDKLESILELSAAVTNLNAIMKASGLEGQYDNPLLLKELLKKLNNDMKMRWATYSLDKDAKGVLAFGSWLQTESRKVYEVLSSSELGSSRREVGRNEKPSQSRVNVHVEGNSIPKCLVCSEQCKSLEVCEAFNNMTPSSRWEKLKELKLCRQCLTAHSMKYPFVCRKAVKCDFVGCTRKHHPLMHLDDNIVTGPPIVVTSQNSHTGMGDLFQFQYIPVTLRHGDKSVDVLAFLDGGSSGTRIEEEVAAHLGLTGPKVILHLKWTANVRRQEESMKVTLMISGAYKGAKEYEIPVAHTIKELNLPKQTLNYEELAKEYAHLRGLPVVSYFDKQPRIMIGLSDWHVAVPSKTRLAGREDPVATKCKLGWSVFGTGSSSKYQSVNYHIQEFSEPENENLDDLMKHFYSVDSLGIKIPAYDLASREERRANDILEKTSVFDGERFEIGLLWRYNELVLPDSLPMAKNRLATLQRRMQKDSKLKIIMNDQIENYVRKGYVRKLSADELKEEHKRVWYLPLFPVINPNKPEKIRVVWDAAAKVDGISLNSCLLKGPDQLSSLLGILLRFRENAVAITGDISEMFHQIRIASEDQHACRFIWDDGSGEAIYATQVMTFGATCSPSCAQYIKNKNAKRFEKDFPRAVEAIVKNHYVDDLLESVSTAKEAITLAEEVRKIHAAGGFHITKWKSNSKEVMAALEIDHSNVNDCFDLDKESVLTIEKVLGMWWDTRTDSLTYSLRFNKGNKEVLSGQQKPTKRELLKVLMSIFDPLGLIGHFTSYLKVLMQEVWRSGVNWDDEINNDHHEKWLKWSQELSKVESVLIPRCYSIEPTWSATETELHIFVDASKDCSAATAYLRMQTNDHIRCSLVGSRTKVAPIKLLSIPRLELVAALIGARFASSLRQSLSIRIYRTVIWTDSVTVLGWLKSDARRMKGQFIAFRVAEIQEITNILDWRYVPSAMNPADDATKWKRGPSLNMEDRWMRGPSFLLLPEKDWPEDITLTQAIENFSCETNHRVLASVIPLNRFEKWDKLVRVTGYVFRYLYSLLGHKKSDRNLSSQEHERAERLIYKQIQAEGFPSEIKYLKEHGNLSITNQKASHFDSNLLSLKPYLDEHGLMRSQSRIDNAIFLNVETRRPIILPSTHHGTKLLVQKYHEKFRHINHETVVNELRKKYHISKLRQLLRRVRNTCNRCKVMNATSRPPEMAPLPEARVAAFLPPFTYTSVDYAGPFEVAHGRKVEKRWICLFTCLVTRAIHLEIAYNCSADSFILCYRNFLCRRGKVKKIFSDRGTNFIGAEKLLKNNLKSIDHQTIAGQFVNSDLEWHFNPPGSPHMNGCCERLVKSVKIALYAISNVTTYRPNDELFRSFLMEVEDMINSRPLTYLPLDNEQSEALTPNHFIRQSYGGLAPLGDFNDEAKLLKTNALMSQLYARHFWKRWVAEYLPTLARREKWNLPAQPLSVGDIVIVIDERNPRNQWQKGRIIHVKQAKDGQVRSATVQTDTGIYERPAVRLAKLDIGKKEVDLDLVRPNIPRGRMSEK